MKERFVRVSCDICGASREFDAEEEDGWERRVPVLVRNTQTRCFGYSYVNLDLCPTCLSRAVVIERVDPKIGECGKYTWIEPAKNGVTAGEKAAARKERTEQ